MSTTKKTGEFPVAADLHLVDQVAGILGVQTEELAGWQINRIREDRAIDAYVPLEIVDVINVPTDPNNIEWLVALFNERAAEVGGTGQRDPVVVGHVSGEGLYMLDGFHRHEVQVLRGEKILHATIEPNLSYEQVVRRRLEYAHTHPEIEFPRQVGWMQSVWERTPWSDTIPNVLTAFRAFQDDYAYDGTDDVELIDNLSEEVYARIRQWVALQSKEWGYTPSEIRENLAKVESFDHGLMHLVYQKAGTPPAGRISLRHVEAITNIYAGEFDIQEAVVSIVIEHELNPIQTEMLISELEVNNPVSPEEVLGLAKKIDFLKLKTKSNKVKTRKSTSNRRVELPDHYGVNLDVTNVLEAMSLQLPNIRNHVSEGRWSTEDTEHALEITLTLSEILAQVALRSADITKSLS